MSKCSRILAVVLTLCVLSTVIHAQDEVDADEPLLRVLSIIPDSDYSRLPAPGDPAAFAPLVAFANFRAAYAAEGVAFEGFVDFQAQIDAGFTGYNPYGYSIRNFSVLMPQVFAGIGPERDPVTLRFAGPLVGEVMPDTMGLDYFDVWFGATFGNQPLNGMIFGGDFDLSRIGEVHLERGFREESIHGVRAWCHEATSCEGDAQHDTANVEPFNLFDFHSGRKPAFLGVPGILAGAFSRDVLTAIADTVNGDAPSLLDMPDYRTLADAILDAERYEGELIQVYFFSPAAASREVDMTAMEPTEAYDSLAPEWANYGELPPFDLLSVADRAEGDEVLTLVALYYEDPALADAAGSELVSRLATFTGATTFASPIPILSTFPGNVEILKPYVFSSPEIGHYAAVIPIRQDFQFMLDGEERRNFNRVYALISSRIIGQVFYPLWDITLTDWYLEKTDS